MAAEIASAYVRIRPNMEGFQSGVEGGVKSAFSNIAKIAGLALGAKEAFDFGKDIIGHAADLQKQIEAVKEEFGSASKSVLEFNDKAAAGLGISAHVADTASARFGILFNNLGIGKQQAADMTTGFLKLAGSLASLRGRDPATVLQNLPLAAAGNVRSLKQLGIATTAAQISAEAFKLGLTQTINQGLTPAQRAISIYSIATANLATYQAQAAAHSGDLVNQERKLTAEWDNARDSLGAGLLPIVTDLVKALSATLPAAITATKTAFSDFRAEILQFASFVGPAFKPLEKEIGVIKDAFKGGTGEGFAGLKKQFEDLSPAAKGAVIAIGAVTAAVVLLVAAAFPISATILAIVGLGVAFEEAYKHSAKFRDIVGDIGTWITQKLVPAIQNVAKAAAPAFAQLSATASKVWDDLKKDFEVAVGAIEFIWNHFGGTIKQVISNDFGAVITIVQDILKEVEGYVDIFTGVLTGNWSKAWSGLKEVASAGLNAAETVFTTFASDVEAIFTGLWDNLKLVTIEGLSDFTGLLAKVPTSFKAFGQTIGVKNPFGGITEGLKDQVNGIKASDLEDSIKGKLNGVINTVLGTISAANSQKATDAGKKIGAAIGAGAKDGTANGVGAGIGAGVDSAVQAAKQQLATLEVNLAAAQAKLVTDITSSVNKAKQNLVTIGTNLGSDIATALDAPLQVAGDKITAQQDKIAVLFDAKTAKLQAAQAKVSLLQSQLSLKNDQLNLDQIRDEVALPGGQQLSTNNATAVKQLQALLKKAPEQNRAAIQQFINQFQSAALGVTGDKLGIKGQKLDIARSAKETPLQLASERIKVQQDAIDKIKTATAKQLADLTNNFDKDDNLKKFVNGVRKVLSGSEVQKAFKTAGNLLGSSFTDGLTETTNGIIQQARAIKNSPRRAGGGQESTIVRPLTTMAKDQADIKKIQREIGNKQVSLQQKILKASQKTAANTALLKSVPGPTSGQRNPGKQGKKSSALNGTGA